MRQLILFLVFAATSLFAEEPEKIAKVQVFTSPDCPIANSYAPELKRLSDSFEAKGISFHLVYPEVTLSDEEVEQHLEEYGLEIEASIDRSHTLVQIAGATTTPEAVVFDAKGELVYRGRIDNLYSDYGDRKRQASEHYLRDVLDALVAGKEITFTETEPIGCLIEPLPKSSSN